MNLLVNLLKKRPDKDRTTIPFKIRTQSPNFDLNRIPLKTLVVLLLAFYSFVFSETLTPYNRISSKILGYDLQYRVNLPDGFDSMQALPVLFLTDGESYIKRGQVPQVLNRLMRSKKIQPIIAVFVDARDPDDLKVNRRNSQFMCNKKYLQFFSEELIPEIERQFPVGTRREDRTILGVSFGGLNASCFGLMGAQTFSGIGMHSPATRPVPELLPAYQKAEKLPLKVFLSTGTPYDNSTTTRKFRNILRDKGYPLKYIEVEGGHNWDNWRPLIDDVLLFFFKP